MTELAITNYGTLKTAIASWLARSDLTSYIPYFVANAQQRIFYGAVGQFDSPAIRVRAMETAVPLVVSAALSGTDSGAANAYVVTPASTISSYTYGLTITFSALYANTGAATINVSSLGVKSITRPDGSTALQANDILGGAGVTLYYDGTVFRLCDIGCVPLPTRFLAGKRLYFDTNPITNVDYYTPEGFSQRFTVQTAGRPYGYTIESDFLRFGPQPDGTYYGRLLYYQKFANLSNDTDTNWLLTNAPNLYLYGALIEAEPFLKNDGRIATWAGMYQSIASGLQEADSQDRHSSSAMVMRSDVRADFFRK